MKIYNDQDSCIVRRLPEELMSYGLTYEIYRGNFKEGQVDGDGFLSYRNCALTYTG